MSCQIIFRHRFWEYLDLWKKSCSRKSLVKTLRWVKILKSYSCFLCLSWRFWSSTAKEHCCFTSITLIQLKFQFHQWTRYDHYDIPYFKSLTEHFIHWIPGTTSQGTNLDESSVSNSSSNSINGRGMAILIYHIKSLQELHFRNNKIRNQLWWIFCIPGRLSSQNVNFASDVSSFNWILHIIIE